MIIIYGSPGSRAARCLWALEELRLPYDRRDIEEGHVSGPSTAYLALNPSGKVPLLIDGDVTVTESYAINLYLVQSYGRGTLWPDDLAGKANGLQWSFWVATETEPFIAGLFAEHFQRSAEDRSQDVIDRLNAGLALRLSFLDQALAKQPYLGGDQFSIADLNVACGLRNTGKLKVSLTPHTFLERWLRTCLARQAHNKVANMV